MTPVRRDSGRWYDLLLTAFFVAAFGLVVGYLYRLRRRFVGPSPPPRAISPALVTHITGLTEAEAAARQIPLDWDVLKKADWRRFRRQLVRKHLFTFFNLDMVGAALAMYLLGSPWSAFLSLLILVLSFGLNVFQEVYTKRRLDRMVAALQPQATVIRQGRVRSIPLEAIVPDDILVVGLGDRIVVNGEITGDGQIWVNEATDAGGMVRRLKQAGDAVQAGSICVDGQAVYRVTSVEPLETLLTQGLKASVLPRTPTPLQQLIERIFKILFVLVLVFNTLLFVDLGATWLGMAIFDGVLIRDIVSQIFAIAPTSLFLMIAVSYAVGLLRIADVGALVYQSETVESLANTSVICFSSSGGLTGQQASLETMPAPAGYDQLSESRIRHILGTCLHSVPSRQPIRLALAQTFPGEARRVTELAPFYSAFGWSGLTFEHDDLWGTYILGDGDLLQPHLVVDSVDDEPAPEDAELGQTDRLDWLRRVWPFKSSTPSQPPPARGRSQNLPPSEGDRGEGNAPQTKLSALELKVGGIEGGLSIDDKPPAEEATQFTFKERWRGRFRRWFAPLSVEPRTDNRAKPGQDDAALSLLFAYHPEAVPLHDETGWPRLPQTLLPLGWVHLSESIRPEAVEVVQAFVKAGVNIKILSADAPDRLATTAKQLNLSGEATPTVVSGADLPQMEASTFARTVQTQDFFAHLTPDQQAALVRELRAQGAYVAVVGSQVNDIPAMQQANLSITSQSGGQATLSLADIVLLEESLTVLPNVLYRGQQIVNGLLDLFKLYLTHLAAHLLLFVTVVFILFIPAPYSSTQASIISFFGITVPAIFLPFWASIGPVSKRSMVRQLVHFVLPAALTTAVLATSIYAWYVQATADIEYARLVVTHALVIAALVRVIFVKPPTPFWVGGNPLSGDWRPVWMTAGAAAIYVVFVAITAAVPTFQGWFDLDALDQPQDYLVIAMAVAIWALVTRTVWRLLWRYRGWFKDN